VHPHTQAYFYATAASISFSTASLVVAHYARNVSFVWMNFFKAVVCFVLMSLTLAVTAAWNSVDTSAIAALMISGMIGLGIGDLFLLQAYARIGAGRTLILFGFQPLFIGAAASYLFNQPFGIYRLVSIIFFLICLFLFSYEKFKEHGHWEIIGLVAALLGVMFDNTGVLLTRWAFDSQPQLLPLQANFIRCGGAILFFIFFSPFLKAQLFKRFKSLETKDRWYVTIAAAAGTYMSLMLYLNAIRIGHLASLSAIGVCGPLFSTSLECIVDRKWPSIYLWLSLLSFLIGFTILLSL